MASKEEPHHHFAVGADWLSIQDVICVARDQEQVADLTDEARSKVEQSARWVDAAVQGVGESAARPVKGYYGINTGFGALAAKILSSEHTKVLMRNLVASHSVGVGAYFDEETVRAAMLIRAHSLAQGYSGVRPAIIEKLIQMLNRRVYPAVPAKGSLGASGDLAPLSHLALVMSKVPESAPDDMHHALDPTSGEAFIPQNALDSGNAAHAATYHVTEHRVTGVQTLWRRVSGKEAMASVGGQIELHAKEGLGLNNGTTFSAAIATLTLHDAWNLLEHAELALAMTLEAIGGFRDPFFPQVHEVRGHPGAIATAANVLRYVAGSTLLDPGDIQTDPQRKPPQDLYSVRCAPQVLGAVRDTLDFVQRTVEIELNAATDNPLIFTDLPRDYKTVSCGNFHGEPIAMAMDFLGIAITELGNIADRRIFKLTMCNFSDDPKDGPDFLIDTDEAIKGLNSGLMLTQYTAASLVSDCKTLAHPDSVDSIPSSANQEDHVSMSLNAARHAREIVDNIEAVIAIELLVAAQALDLRLKQEGKKELEEGRKGAVQLGQGTRAACDRIRKDVAYLAQDRVLYPDIRRIIQLLRSGELVRLARSAKVAIPA
jgi:histidine ammonia-lyase